MPESQRRNPLLPWLVGLPIVVVAVAYVGYRFTVLDCAVPAISVILVLGVVPLIYLILMYLTFKSQN